MAATPRPDLCSVILLNVKRELSKVIRRTLEGGYKRPLLMLTVPVSREFPLFQSCSLIPFALLDRRVSTYLPGKLLQVTFLFDRL